MDWPRTLDVLVEYSDEDKKEKKARLLRSVPHYGYVYGPMAEYETPEGEKFWLEAEYLRECQESSKIVRIPYEVIRKNREIQEKLAAGQAQINKDHQQQETGITIPDGIKV